MAESQRKIEVDIAQFPIANYNIEQVHFIGEINDICGSKKEMTCLHIEELDARVFGDIPFKARARITDFLDPELEMTIESKMPIEDFSRLLRDDNFEPRGGKVALSMEYKHPISESIDIREQIKHADLKGQVLLHQVNLHYPYRGFDLYALDGQIEFDNQTIEIDELYMDLNKNPMILDGTCYDCIPFILDEAVPFNLELDMSCSKFDFAKFYTPAKIEERITTRSSNESNQTIDRILAEGTMIINTNIDSLVYYTFLAEQVSGFAYLEDQVIQMDHVEMKLGEGDLKINGSIENIDIDQPKVGVEVYIQNLRTDTLLHAFDNFNQDKVTYKNVKGLMNADISFSSVFDKDYKVITDSLFGDLQIELQDGELKDFGPLKNLKGFLFKKRKLDDVYFDKLNTKLSIRGQDLHISRFDLNATAITLGIEGVYTFSDEDRTAILMEIPISNLFKRHIDRKELLEQKKSRGGKTILVDLYEVDKKLKFRLHKVDKKEKRRKRKLFRRKK